MDKNEPMVLSRESDFYYFWRALEIIKSKGVKFLLLAMYSKIKWKAYFLFSDRKATILFEAALKINPNKPIVIFRPVISWNVPLYQRPQHVAVEMSKKNILYVFATIGGYDELITFKKINESSSLYLTSNYNAILKSVLKQPKIRSKLILHCYAQDPSLFIEEIELVLNNGGKVLYEYIDAFDDQLSVSKHLVWERHLKVLKDERVTIISTAQTLYDEVFSYRRANFALVTNGVEYEHFVKASQTKIEEMPEVIANLKKSKKKVIGYFGAFASWFDYALVEKLSDQFPECEFLLLGWDYDGSLSKRTSILSKKNITILGPINYKDLPKYASVFDISTIPFIINDITKATSPIKLFEYMALGKPILTTNMPECQKYKSVHIAQTHDEFSDLLRKLVYTDPEKSYYALLRDEAKKNTWAQKADDIISLLV